MWAVKYCVIFYCGVPGDSHLYGWEDKNLNNRREYFLHVSHYSTALSLHTLQKKTLNTSQTFNKSQNTEHWKEANCLL